MLGLDHLGSYDINESACRTARANLGNQISCLDLTKFNPNKDLFNPDLIVGSPPCQGFSNEGYKKEKDPRNSLVWTFFNLVEMLSPQVWIFENVPGFKRLYNGVYYEALKHRLNSMSYYCNSFLIDASHYGVPQKRQRFFWCISYLQKYFFPIYSQMSCCLKTINFWLYSCIEMHPIFCNRSKRI